jgi:hypothetical protein
MASPVKESCHEVEMGFITLKRVSKSAKTFICCLGKFQEICCFQVMKGYLFTCEVATLF